MNVRLTINVAILTAILAIAALLLHPFGYLGSFWPPSDICPAPSDAQFPFFAFLALIEATALGLGVSFLTWGYPYVSRAFSVRWKKIGVYLSIAWQLINWWPHDSLHMHAGVDLRKMLYIEYGFHVTLIISACVLASAFIFNSQRATGSYNAAWVPI
ncbi:MAG: hypothetical protein ACXW1F_07805 [Halobacteriota archaeon]